MNLKHLGWTFQDVKLWHCSFKIWVFLASIFTEASRGVHIQALTNPNKKQHLTLQTSLQQVLDVIFFPCVSNLQLACNMKQLVVLLYCLNWPVQTGSITRNNHSAIFSLTLDGMPRRSPFGKVNSLLSSRTLFKFSTHSGSTSPSKMIHCLLLISPRTLSMILECKKWEHLNLLREWNKIFALY